MGVTSHHIHKSYLHLHRVHSRGQESWAILELCLSQKLIKVNLLLEGIYNFKNYSFTFETLKI